jgi:hypothetical protein
MSFVSLRISLGLFLFISRMTEPASPFVINVEKPDDCGQNNVTFLVVKTGPYWAVHSV